MKTFKGEGFLFSFLVLISWPGLLLPMWLRNLPISRANLEFTGPWAEVTKTMKNAMVLEAERINKMGGIDGHPLELIFEDNGFDLNRAAANMTKFTKG